jgi:sugar lactone lactonase YvrE
MKRTVVSIVAVLLLLASQALAFRLVRVWVTERVFDTPESVCFDEQREILYVSNIAGKPDEKNGRGFISRVGLDGEIRKLKWIDGLNAPKGMAVHGGMLYVADIDELAVIDIKTDQIVERYRGEGAVFLNDVAADAEGNIYVSDSSKENSAIYILSGGKFEIWPGQKGLFRPNGLCIDGGSLIVGNSGTGTLKAIDIESGKMTEAAVAGSPIDGVEIDGRGNFIVSDWRGRTAIIEREGYITVLLDTRGEKINSADIEFVEGDDLVIIPTFHDNRVVATRLIYR